MGFGSMLAAQERMQETKMVGGAAMYPTNADVYQSNGVIQVVDAVAMPR